MIIITIIVIVAIAAAVGTFIFVKNNPNKVKKIEKVVDVIKE